ncbi:hypothetical protein FHL15_001533 [Xylaria flabelliformis]|uniref:Uncharacterized protein n=1 Tax=Xylaria flabelliformis TaxID=2512241 RepID=A0A553IC48_9PEZI|nr:hypothetical protein FHL15_001533 [Xylaria flabelliformis]
MRVLRPDRIGGFKFALKYPCWDGDDIFDMCEPIGSIVSIDEALDIAVIRMKPNELMTDKWGSDYDDNRQPFRHKPSVVAQYHPLQHGSASSFVNKKNFLEGQAARLRRELERAWEIIQEKDRRLQELTTGERDPKLGTSTDDSLSLASGRHPRLEFASSEASPDMTNLSTYQFTALKTERETKMRTKWLAQVDANEALNREKQEIKRGIAQAIEAISKVHDGRKEADNYEGLLKIASDLNNSLDNSADLKVFAGQLKLKRSLNVTRLNSSIIPPFPGKP